ncbi:MAG: oligopeptide/dipeptide ABC transporter ATP-binding protein [Lysobacterales bacterium]|jgi:oligopeptide/dipeptide ABC transporter ATP-binding protein
MKTSIPITDTPEKLLVVEQLSKHFGLKNGLFSRRGPSLPAIDQVSLQIDAGQIYGLVGESGSGKSTLGRAILQLIKPDAGKVFFRGEDLCQAQAGDLNIARKKMRFIFQDSSAALSPRRTILQSLLEPLEQYDTQDPSQHRAKCEEVLETVGLDQDVLGRLPHQLSSGQRQRIGIARAVLTGPDLIIADEAVSALDVSVQAQILDLIRKLRSDQGIAFLFISHDLAVISQVADVVGVMFKGQIVESAPMASLFEHPSHPYTQELLAAIPSPDPAITMKTVHVKAGLSREASTTACVFANRCASVMPQCRDTQPDNIALASGDHFVKCHLLA